MTRIKRVTVRLPAPRETCDPAVLPQRIELIFAARQDFMRIRLMTDIPDNLVIRQIQSEMQSHGQFDRAQIARQMSAGPADLVDKKLTDLLRKLRISGRIDLLDISGFMN